LWKLIAGGQLYPVPDKEKTWMTSGYKKKLEALVREPEIMTALELKQREEPVYYKKAEEIKEIIETEKEGKK
jgi:hypothetical protein